VDSAVVLGKQTRSVNLFETVAHGLHYRRLRRSPLPTWPSRRKNSANVRWHRNDAASVSVRANRMNRRRHQRPWNGQGAIFSNGPATVCTERGAPFATKPAQRPSIARVDGGHRHRGRYVVSR
jgi:hypothetical protein